MTKGLTGGELLAEQIKREGIDTIFTLIGNQVSPTLVHMSDYGIKVIHARNEKGVVHMAEGWAQVKRQAAVAIVSGGPGFANSLTGIIKAYYAQTPLLLITGGVVPRQRDMGVLADIEQVSFVKPYTKWSCTVHDAARIPEYISRGIQFASTGRRGPVVLEIPIDVLKKRVESEPLRYDSDLTREDISLAAPEKVDAFLEMLSLAKRPVIIAGDEVYYEGAEKELAEFVEKTRIPAFTVNKARGCIADIHPLCMGSGRVLEAGPQLYAYQNADTVITIGMENDYQMEYLGPPNFSDEQKFISINKEAFSLINGNYRTDLALLGSVGRVMKQISERIVGLSIDYNFSEWLDLLNENKKRYWEELEKENSRKPTSLVNPYRCIREIQRLIDEDAVIVIDGSNAMFWATLCFNCNHPGQVIIGPDGVLGPMGSGVALAVGAKAAAGDREVVLYTGDGSFGFNAIEFDTAVRLDLPIKVFIHNDETWGFCKTTQEILYNKTEAADLGMIHYEKMAEALGGYGELISDEKDLTEGITKAKESHLPACLNIMVDKYAYSPGANAFNEALKLQK